MANQSLTEEEARAILEYFRTFKVLNNLLNNKQQTTNNQISMKTIFKSLLAFTVLSIVLSSCGNGG